MNTFLGIHNTTDGKRLPFGSLMMADNVDIDDTGEVQRREGYALSQSMTMITSAFSTQDERRLFVVDSGTLKVISPDLSEVIIANGIPSTYIYWLEVADYVFMSTGHVIDSNNTVMSWRIPNPEQLSVSIISGGLFAGQYQLVCTYVDAGGREGGASRPVLIDCPAKSGLSITPVYLTGYSVRLYMTDVNGNEYYFLGEYKSGVIDIINSDTLSAPIDNAQLRAYQAPINIDILAFYNSCLWGAEFSDGQTVLWYSQPFWWNLFNLSDDYIIVPGKVNMLLGHPSGLLIGTDDEIYLYTQEETLVRIAQYGVPSGIPYTKDDLGNIFIWTHQGVCNAFPFENMTERKLSIPSGDVCFTKVIEQKGLRKIVVLTDGKGVADNKLY